MNCLIYWISRSLTAYFLRKYCTCLLLLLIQGSQYIEIFRMIELNTNQCLLWCQGNRSFSPIKQVILCTSIFVLLIMIFELFQISTRFKEVYSIRIVKKICAFMGASISLRYRRLRKDIKIYRKPVHKQNNIIIYSFIITSFSGRFVRKIFIYLIIYLHK